MPKKVKDLKAAPYNPRKISPEALDALGKAMAEFGDLSGIVVNRTTGNIVGGHQRIKKLNPDWEIERRDAKDKTGTVALGHIKTPFGEWGYREVEWSLDKEKAANLAANKHGGEFVIEDVGAILKELDAPGDFDMDLTGFLEDERSGIMDAGNFDPSSEDEQPRLDEKKKIKCPKCEHEFTP